MSTMVYLKYSHNDMTKAILEANKKQFYLNN